MSLKQKRKRTKRFRRLIKKEKRVYYYCTSKNNEIKYERIKVGEIDRNDDAKTKQEAKRRRLNKIKLGRIKRAKEEKNVFTLMQST